VGSSIEQQEYWKRVGASLTVDSDGCLALVEPDGRIRRIPAIVERQRILQDFHEQGAFCSGDRLYYSVRMYFFWPHLRPQCLLQAR
jgi:hypothetical protein